MKTTSTPRWARSWLVLAMFAVLAAGPPAFAERLVRTQDEYREAVKNAEPGDTIVLADGEWRDFEVVFAGQGRPDQPITLTAQTKGKVFLTGRSNLRLGGEHLVVSGLVFKDGHTPTKAVIEFRRNSQELAYHSRVTEVVIDHFNNPERFETDFWVLMYGKNNRFDHNYLVGKSNVGVTMAVRLNSEESQENHHRIDHNYFGPRPILGSNGGETLRIGTSKYSLTDSQTVVENNYFERCNGEVEIISSKSGSNTFKGNVFLESRGTLTLRHGNDNLIEDNVFLGNGVDHTGGIRVINKRQTVRNNYLFGLKGYRFGGALVVMNGVPNSPINRYHQVEDSHIENNTIVDSDHIELAAGSDEERSTVPLSTTFSNNLIVNRTPTRTIKVYDDVSGITFQDNVIDGVLDLPIGQGFDEQEVRLETAVNGLLFAPGLAQLGARRDLPVLQRDATGPTWYAKPDNTGPFEGGQVLSVSPGEDTLTAAVEKSGPGDVLELADGEYLVEKILTLAHPITVKAAAGTAARPRIRYTRSTLFELQDGGSLQLNGVEIDGSAAPDAYGNAAIRTSRYSMLGNYEVLISDAKITNLNTNHSFDLLQVSKHTFASRVEIRDSEVANVSGHVIELDREIDDLGIYNAEYVTVTGTRFDKIGGAIANVYRGGTDESTFGPHVLIENNTLYDVGGNKRNKTGASVFLHGAQVVRITGNHLNGSRPIRVVPTVGEPRSTIENNVVDNSGDSAALRSPLFAKAIAKTRTRIDATFQTPPDVPLPTDAGGGYIDRNALAVMWPGISEEMGLDKNDYALVLTFFMVGYAIGQSLFGKIFDAIGTRMGFLAAIALWSVSCMLHATARGAMSFGLVRFGLAIGEAGNWPGATKSNAEWFPVKERALAQGIFNSGASVGAVVSAPLIAWLYLLIGWKATFVLIGLLGFVWVVPWMIIYKSGPDTHPWLKDEEREYILTGQKVSDDDSGSDGANAFAPGWMEMLSYRQSWSVIASRFFLDPVWWLFVSWLPIYLADQFGFDVKQIGFFAWVPYVLLIAVILFGFQIAIGNIQTLPSDFFSGDSVGSLAGAGGTAAVVGKENIVTNLNNKVAIVTGGARDIGKAVSLKLAASGAKVAVNYFNNEENGKQTLDEITAAGGTGILVQGDMTQTPDVDNLVAKTREAFGDEIHILVNVVGGLGARKTLAEMDEGFFDWIMRLNVTSTFLAMKAAVPFMPRGSSVINLASQAGRDGGGPGASAYAASKGAVMSFTRGMAKEELGPSNIRVNSLCPGMIDTTFHDTFTKDAVREKVAAGTPLRREGQSPEVADLVAYLASEESTFITGANIDINGGLAFS